MHGTISHFSKTMKLALRPRQFFLNFNDVAGTSSGVKGALERTSTKMADIFRSALSVFNHVPLKTRIVLSLYCPLWQKIAPF